MTSASGLSQTRKREADKRDKNPKERACKLFDRLKAFGDRIKQEVGVYQRVISDNRTPRMAKFLLWLATGYLLLPFDVIPDFIPVIGHLDDFIIVPALVIVALKMIPQEVIDDCRSMGEDPP